MYYFVGFLSCRHFIQSAFYPHSKFLSLNQLYLSNYSIFVCLHYPNIFHTNDCRLLFIKCALQSNQICTIQQAKRAIIVTLVMCSIFAIPSFVAHKVIRMGKVDLSQPFGNHSGWDPNKTMHDSQENGHLHMEESDSATELYTVSVTDPDAPELSKLAGKLTFWINSIGAKFLPTSLLFILSVLLVTTMQDAEKRRKKLKPKISVVQCRVHEVTSAPQSPSHLNACNPPSILKISSPKRTHSANINNICSSENECSEGKFVKASYNGSSLGMKKHSTIVIRKSSDVPQKSSTKPFESQKPRGASLGVLTTKEKEINLNKTRSQQNFLRPKISKSEHTNKIIQATTLIQRKISRQIGQTLSGSQGSGTVGREKKMNRTTRLLLAVCGMFIIFYLPQVQHI